MIHDGKKSPKPIVAKLANLIGFASFYERIVPKVRLGNQPDMPTITTDRLWFLRENRFLFLTRDGPIEVTLKPSFVLTGILVCMAGVAAIFYYTLIASYSAIEVMRDETIQKAEASSGIQRTDLAETSLITWQGYQPSIPLGQHSHEINRKLSILDPQIPQHEHNLDRDTSDYLPMIIQDGKRVTFADDEVVESHETLFDVLPSRELTKDQIKTPFAADSGKVPKTVLVYTNTRPAFTNQKRTGELHIHDDYKPESAAISETEILSDPLPTNSPALAQVTTEGEVKTSEPANSVQEFAVAFLPNFIARPNLIKSDTDTLKAEEPRKNTDIKKRPEPASMASSIPDDGLLTNRNNIQNGPVLPIVSEAARIKKMLLSYQQEIDFIRSTIISLGISQDALPAALLMNNQTIEQPSDKEFRSLMIKLAEHRAALRKIPFKSPMFYYYVSSGYGMRKHPKTGKKAFHHGVDLAGTWQENVRATAPGRVVYAGSEGAFGKVVRVQHEFGVVTTYAHLARITVRLGDYVSESHVVGKMGNTGRSVGAHLHYEIRVNDKSINPDNFMKVGRQLSVAGELRQSALTE